MAGGEGPAVIVCDWIPPAFGAVGQYMHQRALGLAAQGRAVTLIGLGEAGGIERDGSLTIVRLAAPKPAKVSLPRRALWALGVNRRLMKETTRALASAPKGQGEVLVTGSPPFLAYWMILANAWFWRRTLIYRTTDFYPETVFAAGHFRGFKWLEKPFHALRRRASRIEALGEDQRARLLAAGVPDAMINVVRDASPLPPAPRAKTAPRRAKGPEITLLYSGNLGVAHELPTLCEAYERHHRLGSGRVRLWVNGQGARLADLVAYCEARALPLKVTPAAPLETLPAVLAAADAHLVLLREGFWGYVLPSKIYACLDLDQPLVFIGPTQSDVHLLAAARRGPYFHIAPGEIDACAAMLERLADQVHGS